VSWENKITARTGIYRLGLVLLELGLTKPLNYTGDQQENVITQNALKDLRSQMGRPYAAIVKRFLEVWGRDGAEDEMDEGILADVRCIEEKAEEYFG
jgi:hypothetical protein